MKKRGGTNTGHNSTLDGPKWKSGGGPILSHFPAIFGFWKFLQVFDISRGKKTFFFKKCPNNGLVSEKKYIIFSVTLGRGGVRPDCNICYNLFFLNEGLPKLDHYWGTFWKKCFSPFNCQTLVKICYPPLFFTQPFFYQNDSEWPKMDLKHHF